MDRVLDDARRAFRHILPGLYFFLVLVVLLIVGKGWPSVKHDFEQILGINLTEIRIGHAVALLIFSWPAGFFFGFFHHFANNFWFTHRAWLFGPFTYGVDHRDVIEEARTAGCLKLLEENKGALKESGSPIGRRAAWSILTSVWYSNPGNQEILKNAIPRVESLGNLYHGVGTAFWAAAIAAALAFYSTAFDTATVLVASVLLVIQFLGFLVISRQFIGVVETTFLLALYEHKKKKNTPTEIPLRKIDKVWPKLSRLPWF